MVSTLCFHELSYSGNIYFSTPDKQLILLLFIIFSLIFLRGSKFTFDKYEVSYLVFIIYSNLITVFNIIYIPALSEQEGLSQNKYVFLIIYNIIFTFIIAYNSILKSASNKKIKIQKYVFNFMFFYIIIALILFVLKIIGLNPNSIGVSDTYGFIRLQGLMPEPSFISIQIIITFIYFLNINKTIPAGLCLLSLILLFLSTSYLMLLIYIFIVIFQRRKSGYLNYVLFFILLISINMIVIFLLMNINNFSNESIFSFIFIRIIGHLKTFLLNFVDLLNGQHYYTNYYYAPRIKALYSNIYLIIENNWLLGNGFGSQIFYLNNWHGSFVSFILAHILEIGIIGLGIELNLILTLLKKINRKDRSIIYMIIIYWLINSQVFFILLYVISPILIYSSHNKINIKKQKFLHKRIL